MSSLFFVLTVSVLLPSLATSQQSPLSVLSDQLGLGADPLGLGAAQAFFRPQVRPFGCQCSNFLWNNGRSIVGECRSADRDGLPICYLHQPNICRDRLDSQRFPGTQQFPGMQVSKIGCNCILGPDGFCDPSVVLFLREGQSHAEEMPKLMGEDGEGLY